MNVKNVRWTIRANVAACGASDREVRDLRSQRRRTQSRTSRLVTTGKKGGSILGTGSGKRAKARGAARRFRRKPESIDGFTRNPTAVQSGNRQATLLGERPRRRKSRSTVCVMSLFTGQCYAEWTEAGPGREQVVPESVRYQKMEWRHSGEKATFRQAHAVTSRVTSWAFWFLLPLSSFAACGFGPRRDAKKKQTGIFFARLRGPTLLKR